VQVAWAPETARVDDAKVRQLLTERGMIKDKRAMPFVQLFKVRSVAWCIFLLWRSTLIRRL
jgi:leucyl-tRNA synthetase